MESQQSLEVDSCSHSGQTVGLVLGPGGIRGCAHSGILATLRDAGITADVIVGASIGALFGAVYAGRVE
jgi:lysophospholipid hydrolase